MALFNVYDGADNDRLIDRNRSESDARALAQRVVDNGYPEPKLVEVDELGEPLTKRERQQRARGEDAKDDSGK